MSLDSKEKSDEIDKFLLGRIAEGDEKAFTLLYEKYNRIIYASAKDILFRKEEADEAVQDAFYRIWEKASLYNPDKSRAFSWIYLIARRVFLNRRTQLLRRSVLEAEFDDGTLPNLENDAIAMLEHREQLHSCMAEFPEKQKQCLILALLHGLTMEEIARKTEHPLGSVKTWIRRGLMIIRRKLKHENE